MSDLTVRRRRADAERSVAAILDAAAKLLSERPHASMEEVARAAGLTRQTVYAHFPSRDALIGALTDRATDRVAAALEGADLDTGPAGEALLRLVQLSWDTFDAEPFLLATPGPHTDPETDRRRHRTVFDVLGEVVERGQRTGEFDPELPPGWIVAATAALGHAAGDDVRAGRLTSAQAGTYLQATLRRLFTR
ncbi:TetR/AcrR family transcriptional regulator [Dactylosporangium darangshiense]|uniref:TetR/AcrR family transcriptional regulator n=1 Tax=Dactylosporangium darangshiense TaxID=579108 RepID=A0ABP8CYM4_9ACTN